MEFMDVVEERRSIRRFYPKPIPMELIGELIHIGSKAPSIGDLQPWSFIIVTKAKKLQDLADACPYERWLYQAPLMIVICSLGDKAETYYPGKGRLWAGLSCAAAAQNISLGAVDVGLSSCWVTSFETYKIREALHIPDTIEPEILIAVGYPDEQPAEKRIIPFHTNTFFNDFGATNTDVSVFKKDYGIFVRNKLEDLKTRAAYETAPRGGLRTKLDTAKTALSRLFRKKPPSGGVGAGTASANAAHSPLSHEHTPTGHARAHEHEHHGHDHAHDGHEHHHEHLDVHNGETPSGTVRKERDDFYPHRDHEETDRDGHDPRVH